jgi:hypothetical protein
MIDLLEDANRLARHLRRLADQRSRQPQTPARWVEKILRSEGFTRSLAGLICNSVKQNRFSFRPPVSRVIARKAWQQDSPAFISWEDYQGLAAEEQSEFRMAFRLSLPDMLLHSIVGNFLTAKLDGILSNSCYAFRVGLGQPAAVKAVRQWHQKEAAWVVKFDVRRFNETVDHCVLLRLLEEHAHPLLEPEEWSLVLGATNALLSASYYAIKRSGKGLLVGSGLTPPLTNLYLCPIDRYLEGQNLPFARYGDDLVVSCGSKDEAQGVLQKLKEIISELKQEPNMSTACDRLCCWLRGLRLRWHTSHDFLASVAAAVKSEKVKTDIYSPGESFDFVGFEFDGPRVYIRQETLAKAKGRLEQYTQRSVRIIERAQARGDRTMGCVLGDADDADHGGELAVAAVGYVRNAIQRINLLLGFRTCLEHRASRRQKITFCPGYGFPWSILRCVNYADVREQFALLDGYAFNRLKRLQVSALGRAGAKLGPLYDFSNFDFRTEGLMTFKDVANRFPAKSSSAERTGQGSQSR